MRANAVTEHNSEPEFDGYTVVFASAAARDAVVASMGAARYRLFSVRVKQLDAGRRALESAMGGAVARLVHEDPGERWDYYLTLLTTTAMVRLCVRAGLRLKEIASLFSGRSDGDQELRLDFLSMLRSTRGKAK